MIRTNESWCFFMQTISCYEMESASLTTGGSLTLCRVTSIDGPGRAFDQIQNNGAPAKREPTQVEGETMNRFVAEVIGRKSRALKHCDKLLKSIEKEGQAVIKLNATGVSLPCTKGDSLHTLLMVERAKLAHEINIIEIAEESRSVIQLPAPVGACDIAKCPICGEDFTKHHGRQKYCSDACQAEARRRRQRKS